MKSELFGTEKLQVETRQPLQRRRMSKASLLNGEFKIEVDCQPSPVNMVAAIHDHISCTKSVEYLKVPETREEKIALACELDHMYANCSAEPRLSKEEIAQIRHLKDLLLLHLDLLQQQHEQLTLKDRQLAALRQERDALQQRLSRAEHHVSVLRQRRTKNEDSQLISSKHEGEEKESSSREDDGSPREDKDSSSSTIVDEVSLRPGDTTQQSAVKLQTKLGSSDTPTSSCSSRLSQSVPSVGESQGFTICSTTQTNTDSSVTESTSSIKQKLVANKSTTQRRDNTLQTDVLYHTSCGQYPAEVELPQDQDVLVPTWRIHSVTSCYSMEGTENLDDDVYIKRHQKQENDERRRKRWDVQRIREIRYQERLKQGRGLTKKQEVNSRQSLDSLFPTVDDVLYIEVADKIPVCAFGASVPTTEKSEFSCPWLDTTKSSQPKVEESSKTNKKRKYGHGKNTT